MNSLAPFKMAPSRALGFGGGLPIIFAFALTLLSVPRALSSQQPSLCEIPTGVAIGIRTRIVTWGSPGAPVPIAPPLLPAISDSTQVQLVSPSDTLLCRTAAEAYAAANPHFGTAPRPVHVLRLESHGYLVFRFDREGEWYLYSLFDSEFRWLKDLIG
jgi:hypothetical protein